MPLRNTASNPLAGKGGPIPDRPGITLDRLQGIARTLSVSEAYRIAREAGFNVQKSIELVTIGKGESGLRTDKKNPTSTAQGWLQILLSAHPSMSVAEANNPQKAADYAYKISSGGRNWSPWTVYRNAVNDGSWKSKVAATKKEVGNTEESLLDRLTPSIGELAPGGVNWGPVLMVGGGALCIVFGVVFITTKVL